MERLERNDVKELSIIDGFIDSGAVDPADDGSSLGLLSAVFTEELVARAEERMVPPEDDAVEGVSSFRLCVVL